MAGCTVCTAPWLHLVQWLDSNSNGWDSSAGLYERGILDCRPVAVIYFSISVQLLFQLKIEKIFFIQKVFLTVICRKQDNMKSVKSLGSMYRRLQVLHVTATRAISITLRGQQFLCLVLIVRSLYGVLVVDGPDRGRMVVGTIAHFGYLRGVFKAVAEVYDRSGAFLSSWKIHKGNSWFRRFHPSCRPMQVKMGSLFHVDHSMMLTMWDIIVNSTVSLLISESVI